MSESHIPQPASGDPGLEVLSTAPTNVEPIPIIEQPIANPIEAAPKVTQFNAIDPIILSQWIYLLSFVWTTSHEVGTTLYKFVLHPSQINSGVAWLSNLYNAWLGNAKLKFKINATGFHAGLLGIFVYPAGVDPDLDSSVPESSFYPWKVMDPKILEPDEILVEDQRDNFYHWLDDPMYVKNSEGKQELNRKAVGKTVVFRVVARLNTSSTGTNSVEVAVWGKPDENTFKLLQYRAPKMLRPTIRLPWFADTFGQVAGSTLANFQTAYITGMRILPATQKILKGGLYNAIQFDGGFVSALHKKYELWSNTFPARINSYGTGNRAVNITSIGNVPDETLPDVAPDMGASMLLESSNIGYFYSAENVESLVYTNHYSWTLTAKTAPDVIAPIGNGQMAFFGNVAKNLELEPGISLPLDNESIVVFTSPTKESTIYGVQTSTQSQFLLAGGMQQIPKNTAPMYQLVDTESGLPLRLLKMNPNGLWSTPAVTDAYNIDVTKTHLVFIGFTNPYDPFMPRPDHRLNFSTLSRDLRLRSRTSRPITDVLKHGFSRSTRTSN